jgi:hemoglobin-like flavoprotein
VAPALARLDGRAEVGNPMRGGAAACESSRARLTARRARDTIRGVLTDEQRSALRLAFDPLMPLPKKLALDFFRKLFELDRGLEETFGGDLDREAAQFALAFSGGMVHLIDEGQVSEAARQLGVRFRGLGLLERDYDTLGRALLALFEERLGPELTPAAREAWGEAWELLATAMQKAAHAAAATAATSATSATSATPAITSG